MFFLVISLMVCPSCANNNPSEMVEQSPSVTTASGDQGYSLDLIVEKVFPKLGFRLLVVMRDNEGHFVVPTGIVNAKAWIQTKGVSPAKKEKLIYEWKDIELPADGYMTVEGPPAAEGIPLILEWGEFHLISDEGVNVEEDTLCTIGVTLTTMDGISYYAEECDIPILIRFTCC
jgi:hypothetical protein